jgi:hypothetical protein
LKTQLKEEYGSGVEFFTAVHYMVAAGSSFGHRGSIRRYHKLANGIDGAKVFSFIYLRGYARFSKLQYFFQ